MGWHASYTIAIITRKPKKIRNHEVAGEIEVDTRMEFTEQKRHIQKHIDLFKTKKKGHKFIAYMSDVKHGQCVWLIDIINTIKSQFPDIIYIAGSGTADSMEFLMDDYFDMYRLEEDSDED